MNPLNKIGEGIKEQDWDLVCEGYNAMTGQNLPLPIKSDNITPIQLQVSLKLFKNYMKQMIDEFEFVQIDKPDANQIAVDDVEQPANDDEENVDFNEVTESVEKIGLFGNTTVLITETPKQSQIEENQKRYANREGPKVSRPPPKTYQVKCTDCDKPFKSRVQSGKFGQKCSSCLRATRRDR